MYVMLCFARIDEREPTFKNEELMIGLDMGEIWYFNEQVFSDAEKK